ncbi:MAG: hypothetical protein WDA75_09570 [Candidatus Latescibacterota bacterium]|jgi:hypothetical protein
MNPTSKDRVELVARVYATNQDASRALGITMRGFGCLCRRYGIESPWARTQRSRRSAAWSPHATEE